MTMGTVFRNRATAVWAVLVAATALSWESVHLDGGADDRAIDHRLITVAVMVVAFVKVRFIGREFMELRHAPAVLRRLFEAWLVIVCLAILAVYWTGAH
jgi:hypothetical protein